MPLPGGRPPGRPTGGPTGRPCRSGVLVAAAAAARLLLLAPKGASAAAAECEDKRADCAIFAGRGPRGGGCERHPDYMRVVCAKTCNFCDDSAEEELRIENISLAGTEAKAISARGARRWAFFELPVAAGEDAVCAGGQSASSTAEAAAGGSCSGSSAELRTHLAVANFYDSRSHALNSTVYRWNLTAQAFVAHQAIPTVGAWDLESFELGGSRYLAVASSFDGASRSLNSTLYRWDAEGDRFVLHQELRTEGAMDVEFFSGGGGGGAVALLAFTGNPGGKRGGTGKADCIIYRWDGARFAEFQVIETTGGFDAEVILVDEGREVLLVLVHERRTDVYRAALGSLQAGGEGLSFLQHLEVPYGRDAAHHWLDGTLYLALAVLRDDTSYEAESRVFAWRQETSGFEEVHRIESNGAYAVRFVEAETPSGGRLYGGPVLLVANQRNGTSNIYSARPGGWDNLESLATEAVYDVAWHYVREAGMHYLGIARFWD